jgi:hypothetical protein
MIWRSGEQHSRRHVGCLRETGRWAMVMVTAARDPERTSTVD